MKQRSHISIKENDTQLVNVTYRVANPEKNRYSIELNYGCSEEGGGTVLVIIAIIALVFDEADPRQLWKKLRIEMGEKMWGFTKEENWFFHKQAS